MLSQSRKAHNGKEVREELIDQYRIHIHSTGSAPIEIIGNPLSTLAVPGYPFPHGTSASMHVAPLRDPNFSFKP